MYYTARAVSTRLPDIWEPEATDTDRIMADQPVGVAGVGAVTIAMQSLNMSPSQASSLVNSQGGTNVSVSTLTGAVGAQAAATSGMPAPAGVLSGRLPITPVLNSSLQFLGGDPNRALLIIQNNEPTGGATLLVSFDPITSTSPAYYLNFGPGGFGILLDQAVPSNPIYLGWSGSPTVGGVIMYGSKATPKQPPNLSAVPSGVVLANLVPGNVRTAA